MRKTHEDILGSANFLDRLLIKEEESYKEYKLVVFSKGLGELTVRSTSVYSITTYIDLDGITGVKIPND